MSRPTSLVIRRRGERYCALRPIPSSCALPIAGLDRHSVKAVETSEQRVVDQIAERLCDVYRDVPRDRVVRLVHEQQARFDGRPIRDFISLFVERNAKVELAKMATG